MRQKDGFKCDSMRSISQVQFFFAIWTTDRDSVCQDAKRTIRKAKLLMHSPNRK